jgi:hypothetical protein
MLLNLVTMLELGKNCSLALDTNMIHEAISWMFFHIRVFEALNRKFQPPAKPHSPSRLPRDANIFGDSSLP